MMGAVDMFDVFLRVQNVKWPPVNNLQFASHIFQIASEAW